MNNESANRLWQLSVSMLLFAAPLVAVSNATAVQTSSASRGERAIVEIASPTAVQTFPEIAEHSVKKTVRLTMTAYSSTVDQTDGDPFTTASGAKVRDGIIAYNFLPFGTRVRFPDQFGDKIFVVLDRMHPRKGRFIGDIWMPTRADAISWGARTVRMEILGS